jgi:iron complex transport system ATP-binding protein
VTTFEARDLVVRYAPGTPPALNGVSMVVEEGAFYAVLGPNGSGKSTLLRALLGVVRPHTGEVSLRGIPLDRWHRRELARTVGVVPQLESVAFPLTVRELVAMGRYPHLGPLRAEGEADRIAIRQALEQCDVARLRERPITTLSGGELQRVRIARALAQEPRALALDEPTASLDIRHEMSIFELLRRSVDEGLTVLVVTHNLNIAARFADRLLVLDRGKVAAEGVAEDVLTEEVLGRVYQWPVSVQREQATGGLQVTPLTRPRP